MYETSSLHVSLILQLTLIFFLIYVNLVGASCNIQGPITQPQENCLMGWWQEDKLVVDFYICIQNYKIKKKTDLPW